MWPGPTVLIVLHTVDGFDEIYCAVCQTIEEVNARVLELQARPDVRIVKIGNAPVYYAEGGG
jgi:LSD1 subclass zinc finger protein